jgi:hypothetical protein
MAWLLVIPCIICTLFTFSYDYLVVPFIGFFNLEPMPTELGRLISLGITTLVFVAFAYLANKRSFVFPPKNQWAWYSVLGNVSLSIVSYFGWYWNIAHFKVFALPLLLCLPVLIVWAALKTPKSTR